MKIALFGIFGVRNLGNECTLQAMLCNLRTRLPGAELYSICYEPQDTSRRYNLAALPVSRRHSRNGASDEAPRRTGGLNRLLRILFRRIPGELWEWFETVKALKGTHLVAMTGTGMLTDYSTSAFGYPYDVLKWTVAARLAGCKVRFVGVGVGPLYERLSRRFIKYALLLADYRSYRDDVSKRRLEILGLATGGDPVFPDLAFSLPKGLIPNGDNGVRQKRVVALGVMNYRDAHASTEEDQRLAYSAYLEKMCDLSLWLVEHGYALRIVQGDAKYDQATRQDLRARLQQRGFSYERAGVVDEDSASVGDLLAQLVQADVLISPRFHNLVLAIMLNIPVISISYDPKNDALLEGVGLGSYCQPMASLSVPKLIDQFLELEARSGEIKPLLRKTANKYRALLEQQYQSILKDLS